MALGYELHGTSVYMERACVVMARINRDGPGADVVTVDNSGSSSGWNYDYLERLAPKRNESDEAIIARCDQSVRGRRRVELAIVHRLIRDLVAAGYKLAVDDGDGEQQYGDEKHLVEAVFSVDEAMINAERGRDDATVWLVMGNDGHDVISDYTVNLEAIIDPINDWVDGEVEAGRF